MENIILRSFIVLTLLFFLTKLLGKKQVSQLSLFDYIVGITIGNIAADISLDLEKNLLAGLVSLSIYCLISYLISIITLKNIKLRRFFIGVPTLLMENGKIIESGLKKVKLDINEFLAEARIAGYFNIEEINYAIMELNGNVSFLPYEKDKPTTKSDMKIKVKDNSLTTVAIIDSTYMENNIKAIGKNKKWLDHELKVLGYDSYDEILLATINNNNNKVLVYKKDVKSIKNTVLE